MAQIYRDFKELTKKNKSIFKMMGASGKTGIFKAVWDARTPEVSALKKQLQALVQTTNKYKLDIEEAKADFESIKNTLLSEQLESDTLRNQIHLLNDKYRNLEDNYKKTCQELEKQKKLNESLDFVSKSDQFQLKKVETQFKASHEIGMELESALKEQNEMVDSLSKVLTEKNDIISHLEQKASESESIILEYKRMNHKLAAELDRVSREFEILEKRIP